MEAKEHYWLSSLEHRIAWCFKDVSITVKFWACSLAIFYLELFILRSNYLWISSILGVLLFIALTYFKDWLLPQKKAFSSGLILFIYLEVLDASFSLDGVIGAFSMSSNPLVIMVGLGVGSLIIRSLTVYMVKKKTLEAFKYLEHGAHYSIGALGVLMLISTKIHISEVVTGLIGLTFISLAMISSEVESHVRH